MNLPRICFLGWEGGEGEKQTHTYHTSLYWSLCFFQEETVEYKRQKLFNRLHLKPDITLVNVKNVDHRGPESREKKRSLAQTMQKCRSSGPEIQGKKKESCTNHAKM
eukprot:GEMP01131871.1.p1 GENE.GEMP01131871.1~~GEMP01131871.1.p1  ORF type:complete len:107 (+),score=1.05 GEMP01131871.1:122-442(+)